MHLKMSSVKCRSFNLGLNVLKQFGPYVERNDFHFGCAVVAITSARYGTQLHYSDVIMCAMASQITSLTIVCSTVYSVANKNKTSKLRVTGLCAGNSPVTGEFTTQRASNAENISIRWRHLETVARRVYYNFSALEILTITLHCWTQIWIAPLVATMLSKGSHVWDN